MSRISNPRQPGGITASAAEINKLDGATVTTAQLNRLNEGQTGELRFVQATVISSAGGTAQTEALVTLPPLSVIIHIVASVVDSMNGDATTTLEVGVSGNIDKYIDTADFDPSAAAGTNAFMIGGGNNDQSTAEFINGGDDIIATWTNTASATAGETDIWILYMAPIAVS